MTDPFNLGNDYAYVGNNGNAFGNELDDPFKGFACWLINPWIHPYSECESCILAGVGQVPSQGSGPGASSSSTLKEACSWDKVDSGCEQMVYAEATSVLPLIVSYVYHIRGWESRPRRKWNKIFE